MNRNVRTRQIAIGLGVAIGAALALGAGPLGHASAAITCIPVAALGQVCGQSFDSPDIGAAVVVIDEALDTGTTGARAVLACDPSSHTYRAHVVVAVLDSPSYLVSGQDTAIAC